ncbi:3-hydroxyacyl-CoA dehydrogenase family protein [Chitinophagaceae bacterium LWZ2-11]
MSSQKTICVCGAGTMGSGIAQVAAQSGFKSIQFDVNPAMLEKSKISIQKNIQFLVEKGRISEVESKEILNRIAFTSNISDCVADLVIEAIIEKGEVKVSLFQQLASINSTNCILATNTSSISISAIANKIPNPGRVVGMHFFNPAPIMKLVEVIKGDQTNDEVVANTVEFAQKMNKIPVVCKDVPGFIVNRVARHYYLEAMKLIEAGLADISAVDQIMEASGFKMGPFKLMDLIGMDINYSVSQIVWNDLGKPERLKPSVIQQQKVEAGELGRKTGKGFYTY